jgi:transposase
MITHQPYPSDVSDAEWAFVVPYLCLLPEDAGQRVYDLRDVFDGLRWIVRSGSPWRYLPKDFPPWAMVYQQSRRWLAAVCFEAIVHDLRAVLRFAAGKNPEPTAAIFDGRTIQSTPESGGRAGYDGYKRRKGSKVHMAVDTLGHLLALHVTPANEQERDQVAVLAEAVQEVDRGVGRAGVRRPGLHRRRSGRRRGQLRDPPGGGEPPRGEARVRAVAPALGCGAVVRLDGAIPPLGAGL